MKAKHFIENREIYENIQISAIIRFERPGVGGLLVVIEEIPNF